MCTLRQWIHRLIPLLIGAAALSGTEPLSFSGIYPHLAYFNEEGECGTGAVVPWAGQLWVITYAPHKPFGSTDKLYAISPDLELAIRPESIGGTPANRLIHRESEQLFIGPYAIDAAGEVRVIPYEVMTGRHTGTARHLFDPANKVYYATMEEGFFEVDVHSLEVTEIYEDKHVHKGGTRSTLPGVHGKGLYSGQGRLVFSNNGEHGKEAEYNPFMTAGSLAEWDGEDWTVIRRAQFTEVTGPGGLEGNADPEGDPLWSIGWDARSLILMVLEDGKWSSFRLPKASHSYDGAHGWNTEWPRIREIGEDDYLMTMHGMFWRFPSGFTTSQSGGLAPRSTYLKVIGDFCRWGDRIVLGCDDTANKEFLNTRRAKGHIAAPQSQSNLWFVDPGQLDAIGPVIGRGAVWLDDPVEAGVPSEPFLFNGFIDRALHLVTDQPASVTVQVDAEGIGEWESLETIQADGYAWIAFPDSLQASWVRLISNKDLEKGTAWFTLAGQDNRQAGDRPDKFDGLAAVGTVPSSTGIIRTLDGNQRQLGFAALSEEGTVNYYTLDGEMQLKRGGDEGAWQLMRDATIPSRTGVLEVDDASVIYTAENGDRFRLPKNEAYLNAGPAGFGRLCREVATERDLFNCHGTFFELPARNAGGFPRIRPVSTHNLEVLDYCSYRGLFVMSGVNLEEAGDNPHIIRSDDGQAALWVGAVDDVWSLGKPVGQGGPWLETSAKADVPSDPFLMTGYDAKHLSLSADRKTTVVAEVDLTGTGSWQVHRRFAVSTENAVDYTFPEAFQAYWIRFTSTSDAVVSAQLHYD